MPFYGSGAVSFYRPSPLPTSAVVYNTRCLLSVGLWRIWRADIGCATPFVRLATAVPVAHGVGTIDARTVSIDQHALVIRSPVAQHRRCCPADGRARTRPDVLFLAQRSRRRTRRRNNNVHPRLSQQHMFARVVGPRVSRPLTVALVNYLFIYLFIYFCHPRRLRTVVSARIVRGGDRGEPVTVLQYRAGENGHFYTRNAHQWFLYALQSA